MQDKNGGRVEAYAEGAREFGVLVMVFGPMYSVFDTDDVGWILITNVLFWFFSGVVVFYCGVEAEWTKN